MKKLFVILSLVGLASCNQAEQITPGVMVKEVCCPEIYYAEILHAEKHSVGDTVRIQYNDMPRHQKSYPSTARYGYTTVVIVKK
jgi:hypothetical protein